MSTASYNRIKANRMKTSDVTCNIDSEAYDSFMNSEADLRSVDVITSNITLLGEVSSEVSQAEINDLIGVIAAEYDAQKFDTLFSECKSSVISSIVGPFGIGGIIAKYDKDGGNVTTIHNAQQKIYANENDSYDRTTYTDSKNSAGNSFAKGGQNSEGSKFTRSKLDSTGHLTDAYTGKTEFGSNTSPDHVNSLSGYHKDGGYMQGSKKKADFATDHDNLASTRRDINQSMRDNDKKDWADKKSAGRDVTNEEFFDIDKKRLDQQHKKGKETAAKHLPSNRQKAEYYGAKATLTGISEGAKMGMQQALGLLLAEFFEATFDEISDIYHNGFKSGFNNDSFLSVLKERLSRIAVRLTSKWKEASQAFSSGFISGFLSNLVTVVINTFYTTSKRLVRIIREGFFSLLKAIKMVCFPPENMSLGEAAHQATKLLATGVLVIIGVLIEQKASELIAAVPIIKTYADILTPVLVGSLTALATTLVVYCIDKIDLFDVVAKERHAFTIKMLDSRIESLIKNTDELISEINNMSLKQVTVI